jgi:glycosyltransferase involved in cell wall biosynthesis
LSRSVDLTVVHLRAWKPGRPGLAISACEGVRVVTVTAPQIPGYSDVNIEIYRYLGWLRLRSLLRTCDLIHSVSAEFAGILASTWGRWACVPHLAQIVGSDINSILPRRLTCRSIAGWEEHVHAVACNSQALATGFLELYPQARNVRTVYRGVDLERYHPSGPVIGPLADRPPVRFLFLGGFPAYPDLPHGDNTKGGQTLLDAWKAAEGPLLSTGASLLIGGPQSDADGIARWRARLRNPKQVHLVGPLHPDLIPGYLRSAEVVLMPSLEEGLPNLAMEASACGRAGFGSDVGGMSEVIADGETGLLLPPGDVRAWQNALIAYADRVGPLKAMGRRARRRMELLLDCRQFAPQMLDLYQTALREPLFISQKQP